MIIEESPRWIQELARFIRFKSLLVLHGNVLDLVSFPTQADADGTIRWSHGNRLAGFLQRFLRDEQGYEIVSVVDPVGGLSFSDTEMESRFREIVQDRANGSGSQNDQSAQDARRQENQSRGQAPGAQTGASPMEAMPDIARAMANTRVSCAFVYDLASRLVSSPAELSESELSFFTQVQCASRDAAEIRGEHGTLNNVLILTCEKPDDLPAFLYADNPHTRSIALDRPRRDERTHFFRAIYRGFHGVAQEDHPDADQRAQFAALTDDLAYRDMASLMKLSQQEKLPATALDALLERFKYGVTTSQWDDTNLKQRLRTADARLRERVRGQDAAIARAVDIVKRANLGLAAGASAQSQRPRGVMFLAGPTGVGKTEMAKALAELLFANEEQCVRFDMSEYASEHADQRLLGSPPGYVGYSEGGQLTSQVKENPFCVLLFDEIEKAHPRIFDKFLQILDDGRLTDGRGDTVYFSQSIIIFTSNLGTGRRYSEHGESPEAPVNADMPYDQIRDRILDEITEHFRFTLQRPEILNRFGDNFVVFDYIRAPLDEEIADLLLEQASQQLQQKHGIELTLSSQAHDQFVQIARGNLEHGGRGIRNALDTAVIDPLARWLFDQDTAALTHVEIESISDHGADASLRYELQIGRAHEYPAAR